MSKNIVLIGLMGAGKSTVGRMLAEKFGLSFVDTDELIEQEAKISISKIFSLYGEIYFRELESQVIKRVSVQDSQVISTGGGVVENSENIVNLKRNGIVIYLKASPLELYRRIKQDESRPLLKSENPLKTLEELLEKREPYYNQADYKIDTSFLSMEEIINKAELFARG